MEAIPKSNVPESNFESFREEANFNQREIDRIKRRFARYTNPETNAMDLENFRLIMSAYDACDPEDVESFFRAYDRKNQGFLTCEDFVWGACASDPATVHILNSFTGFERASCIFAFYDQNRSNTLEFSEFQKLIADSSATFRPGSGEKVVISPEAARRLAVEKARDLNCLDEENGYLHFSCIRFRKFYEFVLQEKLRGTSRLFRLRSSLASPNTDNLTTVPQVEQTVNNNPSSDTVVQNMMRSSTSLPNRQNNIEAAQKNSNRIPPNINPSLRVKETIETSSSNNNVIQHSPHANSTTSTLKQPSTSDYRPPPITVDRPVSSPAIPAGPPTQSAQNTHSMAPTTSNTSNNAQQQQKQQVLSTTAPATTTSRNVLSMTNTAGQTNLQMTSSSNLASSQFVVPNSLNHTLSTSQALISGSGVNAATSSVNRSTGVSKTRLHRWLHDRAADMLVDALAGQSLQHILTVRDHLGVSGEKHLLDYSFHSLKILFKLASVLSVVCKAPPIVSYIQKVKPEFLDPKIGILSPVYLQSLLGASLTTATSPSMCEQLRSQFQSCISQMLPFVRSLIGSTWSAHLEPEPIRAVLPPLPPVKFPQSEIDKILKNAIQANPFHPHLRSSVSPSDFEFSRAFASSVARFALDTSHGGSVCRSARNVLTGTFSSDDLPNTPPHSLLDCGRGCNIGRGMDARCVFCCTQGIDESQPRPFHLFSSIPKLVSFLRVGALYLRKQDDSVPITSFNPLQHPIPLVTHIQSPARVIGSLQGQLLELLSILRLGVVSAGGGNDLPYAAPGATVNSANNNANNNSNNNAHNNNVETSSTVGLVVMGDYFGRHAHGGCGLEILCILLALRMRGGARVVLLRGATDASNFILSDEFKACLKQRLTGLSSSGNNVNANEGGESVVDNSDEAVDKVIAAIWEVFESMPLACTIGDGVFVANMGASKAAGQVFAKAGSTNRLVKCLQSVGNDDEAIGEGLSLVASAKSNAKTRLNGVSCEDDSAISSTQNNDQNNSSVICQIQKMKIVRESFIRSIFDQSNDDDWRKSVNREHLVTNVTNFIDYACDNNSIPQPGTCSSSSSPQLSLLGSTETPADYKTVLTSGLVVPEGFAVLSKSCIALFTACNYADAVINDAAIAVVLSPSPPPSESEAKTSSPLAPCRPRITFARFFTPPPAHLQSHPDALLSIVSTSSNQVVATAGNATDGNQQPLAPNTLKPLDLPPNFLCRYFLPPKGNHPPPSMFFRHHYSNEPLGFIASSPAQETPFESNAELLTSTVSSPISSPLQPPTHLPPSRVLPVLICPPLSLSSIGIPPPPPPPSNQNNNNPNQSMTVTASLVNSQGAINQANNVSANVSSNQQNPQSAGTSSSNPAMFSNSTSTPNPAISRSLVVQQKTQSSSSTSIPSEDQNVFSNSGNNAVQAPLSSVSPRVSNLRLDVSP